MKKLMVAACAVALAAVAQAGCIDWSIGNNMWYLPDGETKAPSGTTVYLIDGSTALSVISAAVAEGSLDVASYDWAFGSVDTDNSKGRITENTIDAGTKLTVGQSYDFSALMVYDDEGTIKFMVSDTYNQVAYKSGEEAMSIAFDDTLFGENALTYDASTAPTGWQSVPEPTSGLLLLLGVAGLALRRRRA